MFEPTKLIAHTFGWLKQIPFLPILIDEQLKLFTLFFRPAIFSKMIDLTQELRKMEGVTTKYHKYGGLEFMVNDKEICHLHGDGLVDIRLTKKWRNHYVHLNVVEKHHILEESSWVSYQIMKSDNLEIILDVIQKAYSSNLTQATL